MAQERSLQERPENTVSTRVDLALLGIRGATPVSRTAGAGPSDDGHVRIDGLGAAIPRNPLSPYVLEEGRVLFDGNDIGLDVQAVDRPQFYDLETADGIAYEKIAKLHGSSVLATTVVQTCIRYDADQRCRFCSIEASLEAGDTIAVKTPAQLAEVAEAAVRLDGVAQMVMTTGTSAAKDRGARHLARCVRAIKLWFLSCRFRCSANLPAISGQFRICTTPEQSRSAFTSNLSTRTFDAGGCRARPRSRWTSTALRGKKRFGSSDATRSRRTSWWGSARIRTNW